VTPIRYHEAAEAELLDEIGYLELRAKGLGRRFFAEIRRAGYWIGSVGSSERQTATDARQAYAVKIGGQLIQFSKCNPN
jgi:hypothetical protein